MLDDSTPCTRRDMFKTLFREFASAAGDTAIQFSKAFAPAHGGAPRKALVRPPGAAPEARFLELCTRCDDCVKACPEWVVRKAGPELGRAVEGTPLLLPAENPCLFCDGLPCAAACKTGALTVPPAGSPVRIGLAVVNAAACYMSQGQPCDYCVKACPTAPKAVSLPGRGQPARVDAAACTGCGECAQICPANAVTIEASR